MFERFTHAARTAVVLAQEEARQQGSESIGVLHVLVGVLHDETGAPAAVLSRWGVNAQRVADAADVDDGADREALSALGIDLDEVRRRAEKEFGTGALDERGSRRRRRDSAGAIPFTPAAKAALEQALRAAVFYKDREIGSAQLFLGLLTDEAVVLTLRRLGVTASTAELTTSIRVKLSQAA